MPALSSASKNLSNMTQEHPCTYNVPLAFVDSYPNRPLIIRTVDPLILVQTLLPREQENLVALQLLDITAELEILEQWNPGLPLEVVLKDPKSETMKLYRLCKLQRSHPVRVVIPMVAGFSKAVRVASFLHLPIKIEGTQPDESLLEELSETLEFFLHNKAVCEPIDYFSGLLTALLHKLPVTLWSIQEEDPSLVRYVTDDGIETLARRPFNVHPEKLDRFHFELIKRVLSPDSECASCEFFMNCGGYFKWPNRNYSCDSIKRILQRVQDSAHELQDDLSLYPARTESAT
jgi:hypothetical protein